MTVFFAADGECALIVAACNNTQAVACADGAEIIAARRIFNGNIEFCFANESSIAIETVTVSLLNFE